MMRLPWQRRKPALPPQGGEAERAEAFLNLVRTPEGKILVEWIRSLKDRDFLAYRAAQGNRKDYVDGQVDRAAEILIELEGAGGKLASLRKELRNAARSAS